MGAFCPAQLGCSMLRRVGATQFKVVALLNDSVGTLAGGSYEDSNCKIGVILGTGTNACYAEQTSKISTLPKDSRFRAQMVVNTEWGNFSAPSLPITRASLAYVCRKLMS